MNQENQVVTVSGKRVTVSPTLNRFELFKKSSSNIDYFGVQRTIAGKLFIQFLSGDCFIYSDLPKEVLDLALDAESIGKFFHAYVKGKFPEEKIGSHCVTPYVPEPEEVEEDLGVSFDDFMSDTEY